MKQILPSDGDYTLVTRIDGKTYEVALPKDDHQLLQGLVAGLKKYIIKDHEIAIKKDEEIQVTGNIHDTETLTP